MFFVSTLLIWLNIGPTRGKRPLMLDLLLVYPPCKVDWEHDASACHCSHSVWTYKGVSKSFWTGHLEQELQMVQLCATRCSCITILWVSLVNFAAITFCVASQWVFVVVCVYFVMTHSRNFGYTLIAFGIRNDDESIVTCFNWLLQNSHEGVGKTLIKIETLIIFLHNITLSTRFSPTHTHTRKWGLNVGDQDGRRSCPLLDFFLRIQGSVLYDW